MSYNRDIKQMFTTIGLTLQPGEKLPDEGLPPVSFGPHTIFILPKQHASGDVDNNSLRVSQRPRRAAKHRVMVTCGQCQRVVSFGRLFQHQKRKDHNV